MNPEHLESLLLDRELGELSPAVAELLEAHLALDPAVARRAAELATTVRLARRAVATPLVPPSRALDVGQLRRVARTAQSAVRRSELYRLAACLALGLGLGWLARPVAAPAISGAGISPPAALTAAAPVEPRSTFWSVARLTAGQRPLATPSTTRRNSLR